MTNPKIQLRHDTSTNWQTQNPVLFEGEVAIETDSNKVKIGNGTDNYNTLPYVTDQTKINLDYSNADYQPVNKAGDTMRGILKITSNDPRIYQSHTGATKGTNPSEAFYMGLSFNDKNSDSASHYSKTRLGLIELQSLSDGTEKIVIAPYRNVANSTDNAAFAISIPQSGNGYCTFPNTTCCDGQWVKKNLTVANNVTTSASNVTYSLSSYLPNDGHVYEILMTGYALASESGKFSRLEISSDLLDGLILIQTRARTNAGYDLGGNGIIPVGTGRYIRWNTSTSTSLGGSYTLYLRGYRRIGTNS